eukprot:GFUD01056497.1.p1 GENE.GFUD01056497.1~~GFUD01056497.1.p1  ORF type:complete len:200 (+),score=47.76 GFUD01056497.1:92-601(+)
MDDLNEIKIENIEPLVKVEVDENIVFDEELWDAKPEVELKESEELASDGVVFTCDKCGKHFKKENKLREHKISHDGKACQYCGKILHSYAAIRFHLESKHSGKTFTCDKCGMVLSGSQVLWFHKKSNVCDNELAREKNIVCDMCGKGYKNRKSLNVHIKKKHPQESDSD